MDSHINLVLASISVAGGAASGAACGGKVGWGGSLACGGGSAYSGGAKGGSTIGGKTGGIVTVTNPASDPSRGEPSYGVSITRTEAFWILGTLSTLIIVN